MGAEWFQKTKPTAEEHTFSDLHWEYFSVRHFLIDSEILNIRGGSAPIVQVFLGQSKSQM